MYSSSWLIYGAVAVAALQLGSILAILIRNAWVELRLARSRRRSRVLREIYESLDADRSTPLRRRLARKEILRDIKSLELWLDLVSKAGDDPLGLEGSDYEHVGLVERYSAMLLDAREWTDRAAAAEVLGWTHSVKAVDALLECLHDDKGELVSVRAVALRSLGRIRHPGIVGPLVKSLDSSEPWFPPMIASVLVRVGKPAVDPLCQVLANPEASIPARRWAAHVLGEIGHSRALVSLHGALSDMDSELRAKAATALGALADHRSMNKLLDRLLLDPIPYVRICVAKSLAQMSEDRAIEFLVEALADSEWWVRLRAVEGLAQFGEKARDILIGALHDRDTQVAHEAARALESQGFVAEMLERLPQEEYTHEAGEFLVEIGKAGNLEPLLDELESPDPERVRGVVRVLSRVGDPRAAEDLANLLDSDMAPLLTARIVDALRSVRAPDYVDRIMPLMTSDDEWVRKTAVDYVAAFAGADVLPQVLPLLEDPNPWTRESSLKLIARLRPAQIPVDTIAALLTDEMEFVRAQAIRTLCACDRFEPLAEGGPMSQLEDDEIRQALLQGLATASAPEVIPFVMQMVPRLEDEELDRLRHVVRQAIRFESPEVVADRLKSGGSKHPGPGFRWTVATVVSLWPGDEEILPKEALCRDSSPRVRAAALSAPHDLLNDRPGAWEQADLGLTDEEAWVVRGAIRALVASGVPEAKNRLRRVVRHRDPDVRAEAALGLAQMVDRANLRTLMNATQDRATGARIAATAGLMLLSQPDAFNSWLEILNDPEQAAVLDRWDQQQNPLYASLIRLAGERDDLGGRLVVCRSVFEAEQELLRELDVNPDPDLRVVAVEGFRSLASPRPAGKIMSSYRRDPSPEVRMSALGYLVAQDTYGQRLSLLESALRDPVESIQVTAVHLTVLLPDHVAIPLLVGHLHTRRPAFLDAITDLLAGRMEDDVEPIMDVIMGLETSPDLMLGLIGTLRKVTVPISTEVLELLLDHEWAEVRAQALRALVPRLNAEGLDHVLRAVSDPAPLVRERAIHLLSALADDAPKFRANIDTALIAALRDPAPTVQAQAALSAGLLRINGARSQLVSLRVDPNKRVARAAERAIQLLDRLPTGVES